MFGIPCAIRSTTQFVYMSIVIALSTITTLNPTAYAFRINQLNHKNYGIQQVLCKKLNGASSSSNKTNRPSLFLTQPKPLRAGLGDLFCSIVGIPPKSLYPPLVEDLLRGTSIDPTRSNVNLVRCYKASMDGWSAMDFHKCVDGRGSCLVSALSNKSNRRFGGFNPLGWKSTDDYGSSNAAFLWFEGGSTSTPIIKVPVLPGGGACLFDYASSGPCFGASDLIIGPSQAAVMGFITGPDMENTSASAGSLKNGRSSPGGAYESPIGWPCRGDFSLVEVEVYCNGNIAPR